MKSKADKYSGYIAEINKATGFFIAEIQKVNRKNELKSEATIKISFLKPQQKRFLEEGHIVDLWIKDGILKRIKFLNKKHLTEEQIADAEKRGIEMANSLNFVDLPTYFGKKL